MEKPDHLLSREELHAEVKKQRQQHEKKLQKLAEQHLKPRWLLPPKAPEVVARTEGETLSAENPRDEREFELPHEPIYHGELTEEGDYYCPYGCGLIAIDDAWEAMFHDVAHFEPEDAHQMWKQHQRDLAQQSERPPETSPQRTEAASDDDDGESRQKIKEALAEGKRKREVGHMEADELHKPPKPWLCRRQKVVIAIGTTLIVLAGLFPPWQFVLHGPAGISGSRDVGRSYSPPKYQVLGEMPGADRFYQYNPQWIEVKVDADLLHTSWMIILVATAGVTVLFSERKKGGL